MDQALKRVSTLTKVEFEEFLLVYVPEQAYSRGGVGGLEQQLCEDVSFLDPRAGLAAIH